MTATVGYNTSLEAEGRRAGEDLDDLEREAGIHEQAQRARCGRFMPDLSETPDEYFDAEYDCIRRGIRRTYFSVADRELRRRLIRADRRLSDIGEGMLRRDLAEAERQLARAKDEADRSPWEMAAVLAAGCVALGYGIGGLAGAIGGAVAGFFLGQGTTHNARRNRRRAVETAESEVAALRKSMTKDTRRQPYFSASEEETGDPYDSLS